MSTANDQLLTRLEKAVKSIKSDEDDVVARRATVAVAKELGMVLPSHAEVFKFVHANFTPIHAKLAVLCKTKSWKLLTGLGGLLGQMAVDRVLRDKLVKAGMVVPFLASALSNERASGTALRTLFVFMNHLGDSEREIIATQSAGAVLDLARDLDRPDERFLNSTLLLRLISQQDVDVTHLDIGDTYSFFERGLQQPSARGRMEAFEGFTGLAYNYPDPVRNSPRRVQLIIGHLARHDNPRIRLRGLWAIWHLGYDMHVRPSIITSTVDLPNPAGRINADPELKELMSHSWPISELLERETYSKLSEKYILEAHQSYDYVKLGDRLIRIILATEHALPGGLIRKNAGLHPLTGAPTSKVDLSGPFSTWPEACLLAASALYARDGPNATGAATLECKGLSQQGQHDQARLVALRVLKVHPDWIYGYYVMCLLNPDILEGLVFAEKALARKPPEGYLLRSLLFHAALFAFKLGTDCVNDTGDWLPYSTATTRYDDAWQFCGRSFGYLQDFVRTASHDSAHKVHAMQRTLILMVLMTDNPDGSYPNWYTIKPLLDRLRQYEKIHDIVWGAPSTTIYSVCWGRISEHFEAAVERWEPILKRLDKKSAKDDLHTEILERLEGMFDFGPAPRVPRRSAAPDLAAGLQRCDQCTAPSAALSRCSRCKKKQYCSVECSTRAWPEHRHVCKVPAS